MKPKGTDLSHIRIINAFKCIKTHGANLRSSASQHNFSIKGHKNTGIPAGSHMDPAAAVFQCICYRICNGKLTACYHHRYLDILKHKRQHGRRIGKSICAMDHQDPMIIRTFFRNQVGKMCPVFRPDIRTIQGTEIFHLQLQILGNHSKFAQ